MTTLPGWKTYIVGFLMIVLAGAHSLGYINDDLYKTIEGILTGTGLVTLRAAVAKVK